MPRPENLPDFTSPPLNEVALGAQFAHAEGYQQVLISEVWALFRENFPSVREFPPFPPTFETFGLPRGRGAQLSLSSTPEHSRYVFLSRARDELLQFQQDRLVHNWHKVGDRTNEYPRFEKIIESFENELQTLETYFAGLVPQSLKINQCEVTYNNQILIDESTGAASAQEWLNFVSFGQLQPEDFIMTIRKVVSGPDGKPLGRLIFETGLALAANNQKAIQLNLTFRGKPAETGIGSAIDLLKHGRELVVRSFPEITTDVAHQKWGRIQ